MNRLTMLYLGSLERSSHGDDHMKKKIKESDPYLLRIIGSKVGIFWEYLGIFLRIF